MGKLTNMPPHRIYLQPACCAEGEIDGRRWSEERWEECDCEDPQEDVEYVFSRVMPSPAELAFQAAIEVKATELYDARWRDHPDYRPWMPGGNATTQDDARSEARRLLEAGRAALSQNTESGQ
jgi:hypothetical protein